MPDSDSFAEKVVRNCYGCLAGKDRSCPPGPSGSLHTNRPWERISIDVMGPLPSYDGHRFVLTIVDMFSRYTIATPIKKT